MGEKFRAPAADENYGGELFVKSKKSHILYILSIHSHSLKL